MLGWLFVVSAGAFVLVTILLLASPQDEDGIRDTWGARVLIVLWPVLLVTTIIGFLAAVDALRTKGAIFHRLPTVAQAPLHQKISCHSSQVAGEGTNLRSRPAGAGLLR